MCMHWDLVDLQILRSLSEESAQCLSFSIHSITKDSQNHKELIADVGNTLFRYVFLHLLKYNDSEMLNICVPGEHCY